METNFRVPFYARTAFIAVGIFAFVFALHIGAFIIVPLIFSTMIAMVLNPLVNYFVRKKMNRVLAITLVVSTAIIVVAGIIYIAGVQLTMFGEAYPKLLDKYQEFRIDAVKAVSDKLNIPVSRINKWLVDMQSDFIRNFAFQQRISDVLNIFLVATLIPVYVFLILYYKLLLLEFIGRLFRQNHHEAMKEVLISTNGIIQTYLAGLVLEIFIVAVLNSVGLLILGIDYAILLGIIGAIFNLIPYIGGIAGTILPMAIALVTKDTLIYPLLVFAVYILIQFIDNNFIIPRIVASRVRINALICVVVVLLGGVLWGIAGMFLSIPLTAIIKVIFDHIEPLKPWGYLLGDIVPVARHSLWKK